MLKVFYDYLAGMAINYFEGEKFSAIRKFILKLDTTGEVEHFYSALKERLDKEGRLVICELPDKEEAFTTASFMVNDTQLVIVPEIDVTNAFLTRIRNWVNDDDVRRAVFIICHNPIDSVSHGTENLQSEGKPFHKKKFCKFIENQIKNLPLSNVDRHILDQALEKIKNIGYLDSYTISDYEEIICALANGVIDTSEYPKFGLFADNELANNFELNSDHEIDQRISNNYDAFKFINSSVKNGTIDKDLSNDYTEKFINDVKRSLENYSDKWYNAITFDSVLKSKIVKQGKKKPLVVDSITVKNPNQKLAEGKDFFVNNDTNKGNKKSILIFDYPFDGQIDIDILFSDNFKANVEAESDLDSSKLSVSQSAKHIHVLISNESVSFVKISVNNVTRTDSTSNDKFAFSFAVIGCASKWLDDNISGFSIKACKTTAKKQPFLALNCDNEVIINRKGTSKNTVTVENGFDYAFESDDESLELQFTDDSFNDDATSSGFLTFPDVKIPIVFSGEQLKNIPISGLSVEQKKLSARQSFRYVGDNKLMLGAQEYNATHDFKLKLNIEKQIVDSCALCCRCSDNNDIENISLNVPESVSRAYKDFIAYFSANETLPSLACCDEELIELSKAYIDAVLYEFENIEDEKPLTNEISDLLRLGTVVFDDDKIAFSPFHPINVAHQLELYKCDTSSAVIREDILRRISSDNLVPLIRFDHKELLRAQEQSISPQWTNYASANRKKYKGSREFVAELVKEKINDFVDHFEYLFGSTGNNELIINAVNMGNCKSLFEGIISYYVSIMKEYEDTDGFNPLKISVNVYSNPSVYNVFESLSNKASLKKILENLDIKQKKASFSESEFINLIINSIKYFRLNIKDESYKYAHLAFIEMEEQAEIGYSNREEIISGTMLNGLMSGVTSMYYGSDNNSGSYRTGYGSKFNNCSNDLLELADYYNSAMRVFGTNDPIYKNLVDCTSVDEIESDMINKTYDSSNWVVFIDPRVDLNFFKNDKTQDVMIIHYSDQHTGSSGYDAITVTRKTKQYENIIADYLTQNGLPVGDRREDIRRMIDMFNAVNGDWLLKLISRSSNFTKEKISIQSAIKLALAFLKNDNIFWIPISLEEILRVSGAIGLSKNDGLFSAKNLGYESKPTSDDLLLFGVEKTDDKVLVHLYPLEVKIGYENDNELIKATEQVKRTRQILDENLSYPAHPDFIQNKVYRNFIAQLAIISAEKFNLYHVWDSQDWEQIVNTDIRGKLLNDDFTISSSLRDKLGAGIVMSFKKGSILREAHTQGDITVLRFLESDGKNFITKSVDDIYDAMLEMSGIKDNMLDGFSSLGYVEPEPSYIDENTLSELLSGDSQSVLFDDNADYFDYNFDEDIEDESVVTENNPVRDDVSESSNGMEILIGTDINNNSPIFWYPNDTSKVMHPNTGIIGTMGTGKTQFTKSLITQLVRQQHNNPGGKPLGILIFDYKGDYNRSKTDFINATGAKVYSLDRLPFNPFSLTLSSHPMPKLPLHTASAFRTSLVTTYNLGAKQSNALFEYIKKAYEKKGINPSDASTWDREPPVLADVYENMINSESFKEDSLSAALTTLYDFEIFETDASKTVPLFDFIDGVTVIDLSGYDTTIQNLVVAVTLDLFYAQMQARGHSEIYGNLRQLTKFILVDEADNFLKLGYPAIRRILKEGREYGVGTILSTQFLKHFDTNDDDFSSYILTWIVHKVDDLSSKDVKNLFNPPNKSSEDEILNTIKKLNKHCSLVKLGSSSNPCYVRDKAFWELIQTEVIGV